jgi:hypothetical protein
MIKAGTGGGADLDSLGDVLISLREATSDVDPSVLAEARDEATEMANLVAEMERQQARSDGQNSDDSSRASSLSRALSPPGRCAAFASLFFSPRRSGIRTCFPWWLSISVCRAR